MQEEARNRLRELAAQWRALADDGEQAPAVGCEQLEEDMHITSRRRSRHSAPYRVVVVVRPAPERGLEFRKQLRVVIDRAARFFVLDQHHCLPKFRR